MIKQQTMAEEQGIISYDPATTNMVLDRMYRNRDSFPFDTEVKPESEKGITSGAVYGALAELKGATTLNRGYWNDINSLMAGVPTAEEGSIAYVGEEAPYAVYRYGVSGWADTGKTYAPEISPGNFYTKEEVDGQRQTLETSIANAAVGANYAVLEYVTSVAVTRMQVPLEVRKAGYMIGYNPGTGFTKEVYTGSSTDNAEWQKDANWKTELPEQDLAALAEQAGESASSASESASSAASSEQAASAAAQRAAELVQDAQSSIDAAKDAAGEANAAAEAAREAAESVGEKQGAGKPVGGGSSEVFNNLTDNSVEGAAYAHAEGNLTYAWGDNSHAEGSGDPIRSGKEITPDSTKEEVEGAWNINQTATLPEGQQFQMAWGENSHVEGKNNLVTGKCSHAGGLANMVKGDNNSVHGSQNIVAGKNNLVAGMFHDVSDSDTDANLTGGGNVVAGTRAKVKGHGNIVSGAWNAGCTVTGDSNTVNGACTVVGVFNAVFSRNGSTVKGEENVVYGSSSTITGNRNFSFGGRTVSGGGNVVFKGSGYGNNNFVFYGKAGDEGASVDYAVVLGNSRAGANYTVAIGYDNVADAEYGTAIGKGNRVSGSSGFAAGNGTCAGGIQSVAMGFQSYSMGNYSFALGGGALTLTDEEMQQLSGEDAPAKAVILYLSKYQTDSDSFHMALGKGATVTGKNNLATGDFSSAHGEGNVAGPSHQFVVGKFNSPDSTSVFQVGYGTDSSSRTNLFSVNKDGGATLKGSLSQSSDIRLKENIEPLEDGTLEKLMRLKPSRYTFRADREKKPQTGFIAQETEEVYPELVGESSDGMKTLNYTGLTAPIVKALQELYGMVKAKDKEIESLRERIGELEKLIVK